MVHLRSHAIHIALLLLLLQVPGKGSISEVSMMRANKGSQCKGECCQGQLSAPAWGQ